MITSFIKNRIQKNKAKRIAEHEAYLKMSPLEKVFSFVKTLGSAFVIVLILNGLAIASFVVPTGSMENTVLTGEYLFVNKFKFGPSTPQVIPFFNFALPYYKLPPFWKPVQGDVIVFVFPGNKSEVKSPDFTYYLKRCIAVAGDTLQIINNKTYVNGVEYSLPREGKFEGNYESERDLFPNGMNYSRDNYGPIRIPKKGDVIALTQETMPQWSIFIKREGHAVNDASVTPTIDGKEVTSYTVERDYVFGMGDNRNNSLDSRYWGFIPEHDIVGTPMVVFWSWKIHPDDNPVVDLPLMKKIAGIRWSRLGTIIR